MARLPRQTRRIFTYPVQAVLDLFSGNLEDSPPGWFTPRPIVPRTVKQALAEGRLEAEPWEQRCTRPFKTANERRRWHAARVAYLVRYGWADPIKVEAVKAPVQDYYLLTIHAGNHRLRAASMRGDRTIELEIVGDVPTFQTAIGVGPVA
jgi:hypothetical protein